MVSLVEVEGGEFRGLLRGAGDIGQRRAQALKDALVAGGVAASRIQVTGKKAASTRARSAEVIIAP